jgi:hypothetical protein
MTVLLLAAALVVGTGAIAALAPLDVRLGLVGLTASLVAAAFLVDPLPSPAVLAVRLSAALLAVVMLRAAGVAVTSGEERRNIEAARGWTGRHRGSELGWPAEVLLGAGGATAGLAIATGLRVFTIIGGGDVGQPPAAAAPALFSAPSLGLAAAGLILAVSLGPVLLEPTGLRRAIALVLATEAALLARMAFAPGMAILDEVVFGALLVAVAAGAAALTMANAGARTAAVTGESVVPDASAVVGAAAAVGAAMASSASPQPREP